MKVTLGRILIKISIGEFFPKNAIGFQNILIINNKKLSQSYKNSRRVFTLT